MTIKEIADLQGLTVQAVYKRIKTSGLDLSALKDAKTGHLTADGEQKVLSLFENKKPQEGAEIALKQEVERLKLVNEQLMKQLETLQQNRDDLRAALEREQQLHAMALQKIPQALPSGEKRGLFGWLRHK